MKITFLCVGGQKETWLSDLTDSYQKKIAYFCEFEVSRLKPVRIERASAAQKQRAESTELLRFVKKDDLVIICDERGEATSSQRWSEKLIKFIERGKPRVLIVIGGAYGFNDELRLRADWSWSLSPLTLNHHLAQAVALEQIYRAFAIYKNLPYHND